MTHPKGIISIDPDAPSIFETHPDWWKYSPNEGKVFILGVNGYPVWAYEVGDARTAEAVAQFVNHLIVECPEYVDSKALWRWLEGPIELKIVSPETFQEFTESQAEAN